MAKEKEKELLEEEELDEEETEGQSADDDDDGDDGKGSGKTGSKGTEGKSGKTFSQEQVTRMMAREKSQGRNAAFKEMGIDPKDSKMVSMFKAFVDSQKTEEEKAAEKETENRTKMNEAEQRAQFAEAKAEAMMLGVKAQYVDDLVTLALAKMTEDSDLKTIIGEFKTKYPVWFGESEDDDDDGKNKTGHKGTGSSVNNSSKKKESGKENEGLGARLAAQRKAGSSKKSSYWGK